MAQEGENSTPQDETAPVKPRKASVSREEQDRIITADSAAALALIEAIQGDEEIAGIMAGRGYPLARFSEGRDLQAALQSAVSARQTAMGTAENARAALAVADAAARTRYGDFRGTARPVFTSSADRTALQVNGNVPRDRQRFITLANTSYTNAKAAPYQNILKDYGETSAALNDALAGLKALADAETARTISVIVFIIYPP